MTFLFKITIFLSIIAILLLSYMRLYFNQLAITDPILLHTMVATQNYPKWCGYIGLYIIFTVILWIASLFEYLFIL